MSANSDNWLLRHRFDVDAYSRLREMGILPADAHVELIEGEVMDMTQIDSADHHGAAEGLGLNAAADSWLPRHRFDVDAFHRMSETGILAPDARVELIHGEMLDMAPIGSRHAAVVNRLNSCLVKAFGAHGIVSVQHPLRLDGYSLPQPDVAVLKPRADFYETRHPTAEDVLLVVEVSDTTLRYDRQIKVPLYAARGVTELWLIDVAGKQVLVMREPLRGQYRSSTVNNSGMLQIAALPQLSIDVAWLLGQ